MYRALVIGDAPEECQALSLRLGSLGFDSGTAPFDSVLALRGVFSTKPDVIVFDADSYRAPKDLFRLLVDVSQLPVFVIGSALESEDLVWYLDQGAAFYVVKPVSANLIAARLNSVLRRHDQNPPSGPTRFGDITMDEERREVRKGGNPVMLTPTEFNLLAVLAENVDKPCSRRMLLERVWGEDFIGCSHYLRLYMGYLRHKLEDDPRSPCLLLTEWGIGYRLVSKPSGRRALPAGVPAAASAA